MTRYVKGKPSLKLVSSRNGLFETELRSIVSHRTLADVEDDLRLKQVLRSTVNKVVAPQHLIKSISENIRR